jgi:hypothetical protein
MEKRIHNNVEKLLELFMELRGFQISKLKPGTKMTVETKNSFYEFFIGEDGDITAFGGTRQDGSVRFPSPTPVVIHGSTFGGSMIKADWIGETMHLEFREVGSDSFLLTTQIKNVVLEATDGSWHYSMDWGKENTTC